MPAPVPGGAAAGGVICYPLDRLYEEVAFLAYYFHWEYRTVMAMEHRERQRWCEEASKINRKVSGEEKKAFFEV